MVRVTYSVPRIIRFATSGALLMWTLLSVSLVLLVGLPMECGVLLLVPILLLLWVASRMSGGIIWELDPSGYSVRRGDRPVILIPWSEVRSLVAVGSSAPYSTVLMKLVDKTGKTRAKLVSGYLMGVESIRTLYEAAAYYLKDSGVTVRNNLGWRPTLPESVATEVRGERPRFLLHSVFSLFVAGGLIVATGSFEGQAAPIPFGVALILIATILLAMDRIRHRNRKYRNEGGSG